MIDWISVKERLPEYGQYVLIYVPLRPWLDTGIVKADVVKFVQCEIGFGNVMPYEWHSFGPGKYFGHDVSHWAELNKPEGMQ